MSTIAPLTPLTDDHKAETEPAPRRLSWPQRVSLAAAGLPTAAWTAWLVGDLVYRGSFEPTDVWKVLVFTSLVAWAVFINGARQERISHKLDLLTEHTAALESYHSDLGDRLDNYGAACEAKGHSVVDAIHSNGNGRYLHAVDREQ